MIVLRDWFQSNRHLDTHNILCFSYLTHFVSGLTVTNVHITDLVFHIWLILSPAYKGSINTARFTCLRDSVMLMLSKHWFSSFLHNGRQTIIYIITHPALQCKYIVIGHKMITYWFMIQLYRNILETYISALYYMLQWIITIYISFSSGMITCWIYGRFSFFISIICAQRTHYNCNYCCWYRFLHI